MPPNLEQSRLSIHRAPPDILTLRISRSSLFARVPIRRHFPNAAQQASARSLLAALSGVTSKRHLCLDTLLQRHAKILRTLVGKGPSYRDRRVRALRAVGIMAEGHITGTILQVASASLAALKRKDGRTSHCESLAGHSVQRRHSKDEGRCLLTLDLEKACHQIDRSCSRLCPDWPGTTTRAIPTTTSWCSGQRTLDDRGFQLNFTKCKYIPAMPLPPSAHPQERRRRDGRFDTTSVLRISGRHFRSSKLLIPRVSWKSWTGREIRDPTRLSGHCHPPSVLPRLVSPDSFFPLRAKNADLVECMGGINHVHVTRESCTIHDDGAWHTSGSTRTQSHLTSLCDAHTLDTLMQQAIEGKLELPRLSSDPWSR